MEDNIWRVWRVLFLFSVIGSGELLGVVNGKGANEDAKAMLCRVFAAAKQVLDTHGTILESGIGTIREAVYGYAANHDAIDEGASMNFAAQCFGGNLRNQLCTYYHGSGGVDGCFAKTLIGAFLCACVPGGRIERVNSLCGVPTSEYENQELWTGTLDMGQMAPLFKDVWNRLRVKCSEGPPGETGLTPGLKALREAVNNVKNRVRERAAPGRLKHLGGGEARGDCNGSVPDNICVAYASTPSNEPDIPWATKILSAIQEIEKDGPKATHQDVEANPSAPLPSEQNPVNEPSAETTEPSALSQRPEVASSKSRTRVETKSKMVANPGNSEMASPRAEVNNENHTINDIPPLLTEVKEDGCHIMRATCPLLAVFSF